MRPVSHVQNTRPLPVTGPQVRLRRRCSAATRNHQWTSEGRLAGDDTGSRQPPACVPRPVSAGSRRQPVSPVSVAGLTGAAPVRYETQLSCPARYGSCLRGADGGDGSGLGWRGVAGRQGGCSGSSGTAGPSDRSRRRADTGAGSRAGSTAPPPDRCHRHRTGPPSRYRSRSWTASVDR